MKYSLLIPTRKRIPSLKNFLSQLSLLVENKNDFQIVVTIDNDDDIINYKKMLSTFSAFNFLIINRNPGRFLDLSEIYNNMAERSSGDFLWALNDDIEIWAEDLLDNIFFDFTYKNDLHKKVAYFNMKVRGHPHKDFSPFPMISRHTYNALGHFHHPIIKTWDQDVVLWNTFNALRDKHGYPREFRPLKEVVINHLNEAGDIGDEAQAHMRDGHIQDGGINAGGFKDRGLYEIESRKLLDYIVKGF